MAKNNLLMVIKRCLSKNRIDFSKLVSLNNFCYHNNNF